ncbi:Biopolymer transport protein ExbD/TolR [Pirellula staleyi DSM 6068]|uniref:Biopolymer transport protein ExbD/TolR n=1 Tax=Pirellula staleyi (strain ATCC 27377 / DSM 6068 / ICPB 4128) TaxID=530564 RepID=D2R0Q9_PIRSD|nr:biopolymer transporter ExbD [Pirellula staleyi]ADB16657.1 Biopolymer transport protein ExbD/TolR [Pirellula staleyi DSM 6068]
MKLNRRHRGQPLQMNMTPMIDVTFLLLIFFMTVSQVSAVNKQSIPLPKLRGSQDQQEAAITINVSETGEINVSGNTVSLATVIQDLTTAINEAGGDPSRVAVTLRADRRGNSRMVNEIVRACNKLQIVRLRLAVENSQP